MSRIDIIKVREIAFTKLRKREVYGFYNDIVKVIGRYDTKAMHIEDTCDVLVGMQPKAELLVPKVKGTDAHTLTLKLQNLNEKRLKFAAIITNQMRNVERAELPDTEHLVKLAKPMVFAYMNYLREKDLITIEAFIDEFLDKLRENPAIKDALFELGFKAYLDELESANNDYRKTFSERTAQLSRRQKGSTIPIQRELQNLLRILFDQVDSYQHIYLDINYFRMITALNHTIATYTKSIKTRETQRKNKKLKAKDTSITSEPVDLTGLEKVKPTTTEKKEKEKDQPIDGLLNILKKPDKGKKEDGADSQ